MAVTDAEFRELRYRVEQQGRRIQQLENTRHFVSQDGSFTVFDDSGKPIVKLGKLSDGIYGLQMRDDGGVEVIRLGEQSNGVHNLSMFDASGNATLRLGEQTDGKYNLSVFNTSNVLETRVGQLGSGFGIEDLNAAGDTVRLEELAFGAAVNRIDTAETDAAGGGFTDLATVGPEVTVTVGATGRMLVTLACGIAPGTGGQSQMGFAVSGATTVAANANAAVTVGIGNVGGTGVSGSFFNLGATYLVTGLNSGSHTVTAKYNSTITTGTYSNRFLAAQPF